MKRIFVPVLLGCVLILSGCGGAGPSTTIDVTMTDFQFTPNTFTIPAGQEITVNAVNNGAVVHELVIFKPGLTAGEEFGPEDEENIYWEVEVEAGQSTTVKFTAPSEPGEYYVTCGTEGHLKAGMVASLTVK